MSIKSRIKAANVSAKSRRLTRQKEAWSKLGVMVVALWMVLILICKVIEWLFNINLK